MMLTLDAGLRREVGVVGDASGAVTLGIRPEGIGVSLDGEGDMQIRVKNFEQLGSVTYIYGAFDNGERLTVQLPEQIPLTRNQTLGVTLPTEAFHIFDGESESALELAR